MENLHLKKKTNFRQYFISLGHMNLFLIIIAILLQQNMPSWTSGPSKLTTRETYDR